jgi:hypothetical protein
MTFRTRGAGGALASALLAAALAAACLHTAHASEASDAAAAAFAALSEPALNEADDAPELLEVTPRNFDSHVDGRRAGLLVLAFVHPYLNASAELHPKLHRLNQHYAARPASGVAVGFADVHRHASFARRFAFKALPAVLVFSKGPNMALAPITLSVVNKTFSELRRDVDVLATGLSGLDTLPPPVTLRVHPLVDAVAAREEAARVALASGGPAAAAPDATVAVGADGGSEATAAAAGGGDGAADATPEAALVNAMLADLEAEIAAQLLALDATRFKLEFVRSTMREVADAGIGALAHAMNGVRGTVLSHASSTPLDADLVETSAAERNNLASSIAVLTDMFAGLRGPEAAAGAA